MTQQRHTFEQFFQETEPLLRRALIGGFGPEIGREATAEALAYGWKNWDRIQPMENPSGYLYRVGERWALRDRERFGSGLLIADDLAVATNSDVEPGLVAALDTLTLRQRQVVVLVSSFGLSHQEAADLLGISRSSIQNHAERGMSKLRAALGVTT